MRARMKQMELPAGLDFAVHSYKQTGEPVC
jgi:hypothetical protein